MNLATESPQPIYSLRALLLYFLKLGSIGFGGPVALVGYMQRDLVDGRKWIKEEDFKEGMALSQLAPGPLAAQLAIYIGYVHYRVLGATLVGFAFVLPSFLMVLALGYFYARFNGFPMIEAVFYGVSASIIGIIALSSYKLTKKSIGKDWTHWLIFIALAVATFLTEQENIWLILGGGVLVYFIRMKPIPQLQTVSFLAPSTLHASALVNHSKSFELFLFFLKAGAFVFGSGLAIVPFLYGGVVREYEWLSEKQFLDAVAVAMITPGPIVITVGFIGFLVDGFSGACIAAAATFLPCYLFTILPAPYFKKYGKHPAIKAFVDGVTAAAVGAIAGAVLVLSKRTLVDIPSVSIALVTLLLMLVVKKLQEPILIIFAALTGILLKLFVL